MGEGVFVALAVPLLMILPALVAKAYYGAAKRRAPSSNLSNYLIWISRDVGVATLLVLAAILGYLYYRWFLI